MALRSGYLLILAVLIMLVLPTAAQARRPIISYVDDGSKLQLYDSETGKDVTNPPPITAGFVRLGLSLDGRYVVFTDANNKLHLLDRASNQQIQLPGIDVYANPGNLTVSSTGLIGFDSNSNGPTVVYDSATKAFVDTGLAAHIGHRQPKLSGDGKFLATTCGPPNQANCIVDQGTDSNQYVQNLVTKQDTGFPDGNAQDEEHPCTTNDGSLVGYDRQNPVQRDVFLYDRNASQFISLPGLNDPVKEETHCILSPGGNYLGFLFDNAQIKVFERSTSSYLTLPSNREFDTSSTFSAPFPPENATKPAPTQGTVSDFSMENKRFRVGSDPTPTIARKGKTRRAPRGSAFRYSLSSATTVKIAVARQQRGRKSGKKCRKPTRKLRKHKKCTRSVLRGTLTRHAATGANTTAFSGRIGSKALHRGRYLATISAGNQKQAKFTIVAR